MLKLGTVLGRVEGLFMEEYFPVQRKTDRHVRTHTGRGHGKGASGKLSLSKYAVGLL